MKDELYIYRLLEEAPGMVDHLSRRELRRILVWAEESSVGDIDQLRARLRDLVLKTGQV